MLTSFNQVLIREDGTRVAAKDLQISDMVFDPWAKEYVEIIDILAREVTFNGTFGNQSEILKPIQIQVGTVSADRPYNDILVSKNQIMLFAEQNKVKGAPSILKELTAGQFVSNKTKTGSAPNVDNVCYFAIFTAKPQMLDVSGLLLRTFCNDVYRA